MEIKTPQGVLKAEVIHDSNYPGIKITLDDEIVAIVEHTEKRGICTNAYNNIDEEPTIIIY
jgi:hypothetical protein